MTPELRRRLVTMLAGAAGAIVGLLAATWLRQDGCLDRGGRWLAAARSCELPAGVAEPRLGAYALGLGAGIVTAVLLLRAYAFVAGRGRPSA